MAGDFSRADPGKRRAAQAAWAKKWRDANPELNRERIRNNDLKRHYGITPAEYEALFVAQGGVCAICGQPEHLMWKGKLRRLAVDHDHKTGKVRALLCSDCNTSIGKMHDDPYLLRRAADYIEEYRSYADLIDGRPIGFRGDD